MRRTRSNRPVKKIQTSLLEKFDGILSRREPSRASYEVKMQDDHALSRSGLLFEGVTKTPRGKKKSSTFVGSKSEGPARGSRDTNSPKLQNAAVLSRPKMPSRERRSNSQRNKAKLKISEQRPKLLRTISSRVSLNTGHAEQKLTNSIESAISTLHRELKVHREEFLSFKSSVTQQLKEIKSLFIQFATRQESGEKSSILSGRLLHSQQEPLQIDAAARKGSANCHFPNQKLGLVKHSSAKEVAARAHLRRAKSVEHLNVNESDVFYYLDSQRNIQGPFESSLMESWFANGDLLPDTAVSKSGSAWTPLQRFFF